MKHFEEATIERRIAGLEYRLLLSKDGGGTEEIDAFEQKLSPEAARHFSKRLADLGRALVSKKTDKYARAYGIGGIRRYATAGGRTIFRIPTETFPSHVNNIYLILDRSLRTLFDCGSGQYNTEQDLERGFEIVRKYYGEDADWRRVDYLIISHAHIDHFGNAQAFREKTKAKILIHELDARVVSNFEERIIVASKDLRVFLQRSGTPEEMTRNFEEMYSITKQIVRSVALDRHLRDGDKIANAYIVHHTPGHCPGQVCLQVDNVLLTADHVLPRITPHQAPGSITQFTGLEHYFNSLEKVRSIDGIDLALPGHEEEIPDLRRRVDEILSHHHERLDRVREICRKPKNVWEVYEQLFGERDGYERLLGLLEAGAHVEYLYQRGALRIANLNEVAESDQPVLAYQLR